MILTGEGGQSTPRKVRALTTNSRKKALRYGRDLTDRPRLDATTTTTTTTTTTNNNNNNNNKEDF